MPGNSLNDIQITTSAQLLLHPQAFIEGILVSESAKTCTSMAQTIKISHDVLQKILDSKVKTENDLRKFLIETVNIYVIPGRKLFLIIDDTLVVKEFSEILEMLGIVNKANLHDEKKGYKIVVMIWSDGQVTIPIDFRVWIDGKGKTKLELAQEMITENYKKIPFDIILMDGLYPSQEMMQLLDQLNIWFIIRFPKNRYVRKTMQELEAKVGDHWQFKLKRNKRAKQFECFVKGIKRYITAYKQKNKNLEYETRYLISNFKENAQKIVAWYEYRWDIEKFFRTVKQKLGLQDCMARSLLGQKKHILLVFVAYAIANLFKVANNCKSTDEAIRMIRSQYREGKKLNIQDWIIFSASA